MAAELAALPAPYKPPGGALLVAHAGSDVAGCVGLRALDDRTGEMKRLYVRPAYRTCGLGKRLVETVIQLARRAGYSELRLDTLPGMKDKPKSYAVVAGYTDNVGSRDHNEGLSRERAQMVARCLKDQGIDDSRMVLFWYGPNNPVVANDTAENKAKNRRVELAVGLGE